ncbi:MAG: hypothetical protein BJ554DRAFT_1546 [Olpidium bornovanus]|uniref:Uncharacterized protein n=1 Tax=Olpidium bornovanus TaxID=278681 RepID=A0A8H7ZRW6_9FUNG|nr:MAG: hypothetical protein BJ554DRAFT_1546 [Olpidium bornovanus]
MSLHPLEPRPEQYGSLDIALLLHEHSRLSNSMNHLRASNEQLAEYCRRRRRRGGEERGDDDDDDDDDDGEDGPEFALAITENEGVIRRQERLLKMLRTSLEEGLRSGRYAGAAAAHRYQYEIAKVLLAGPPSSPGAAEEVGPPNGGDRTPAAPECASRGRAGNAGVFV